MVNVLIADDNLFYARNLMNFINKENSNIKVIYITINGEETILKLNQEENIDVILLDLKMPKLSGIEVLDMLAEEKKEKYKKSCIVISGEIDMISQIIQNEFVYSYILKTSDFTKIVNQINWLIEQKEAIKYDKYISKTIYEELCLLNFNFSHIGTKYLADTIYILVKSNVENLSKEVYPILSKRYNKSILNIKCNLYSAVNSMYYDCESSILKNYFKFSEDMKPTTKLVANTISNKIKKRLSNMQENLS